MALTDKLTAIADAIRAKTGKSDSLTLDQMPTEIANITGGGGSSADVRYVTFTNASTGETFVKPVIKGDDCVDVVAKGLWAKPTQESTAQYDYAFANSWSAEPNGSADANILKNITEDKTVYAVFTETPRKYLITYYDEDGTTVLHTEQVAYNDFPSYTPTKTGYAFDHWTPTPVRVTGDASYTAVWGTVTASGTTANGQAWTLFSSGKLQISGTGVMPTYNTSSSTRAPWYIYRSQITSVEIADGITSVGNYAFYQCTAITSANIPDSVVEIGEGVFSGCTALTSANIPSGVTVIKRMLFNGCTNLVNVTIPSGVTEIQQQAFNKCTSLAAINLPQGLTAIGQQAFYQTAITSVTIPSGVKQIATSAFCGCPNLASVNLNSGLEIIGQHAFNGATITTITIPNSVTIIYNNAFANCNSLASATFENTSGWILASSSGATSGDDVDVTDQAVNATNLVTTYKDKYWKRL